FRSFEPFRGISHLLMEKVTKELRRGGSPPPPRRAPAVVPATPASASPAVSSNAPATPPARAIEREAKQTRAAEPLAPAAAAQDFGREIQLPDEIPPRETRSAASPVSAGGASERDMVMSGSSLDLPSAG